MTASSQRILSYIYFIIAIIALVSITKRVIGPLDYDIVIINGEVFDTETSAAFSPGTQIRLEVVTNVEAGSLLKQYYWSDRNNVGRFSSSPYTRAVSYVVGEAQSFAAVTCVIDATGAENPSVTTPLIRITSF